MNFFPAERYPAASAYMTLLPETLCIDVHGGESDGTSGRDTDRYLGIIITDRSSQDRVCAGEALVGREECDLRDAIRLNDTGS